MNQRVEKALQEQINKEFYSAYLYLSMEQYFVEENMPGMANWMHQQFEEEQAHGMKMVGYLNTQGVKVELEAIQKPDREWHSIKEVFENVLHHEQFISNSIKEIQKIASEEHDYSAINFLQWFIDEQIEEEDNARMLIKQLELIGDNGYGLLMLDRELADRKFEDVE